MVAYGWVTLYMVLIALEMLWGKKIVGDVKVNLTTSVFCTNLFAFFPMVLLGYLRDDYAEIDPDWFELDTITHTLRQTNMFNISP